MSMLDFAHHVIAVANEHDIRVTNLQLQKVMYFSFKEAMEEGIIDRTHAVEIYDKPFQVWRYGPVERNVYELYKPNGASPIIEENSEVDTFKPLNEVILKYLRRNPFDLVKESHREKFWLDNEKYISGWRSLVAYELGDIVGR